MKTSFGFLICVFGLSCLWLPITALGQEATPEAVSHQKAEQPAAITEDTLKGKWYAQDELAVIDIYKTGDTWNGKIVWLKEPIETDPKSPAYGKECVDFRNPDPTKRNRFINGIVILENFKWDGEEFTDGTIYDPDLGKTYTCRIEFIDKDTIDVRGYIGIPILGRSEVWKRKKD